MTVSKEAFIYALTHPIFEVPEDEHTLDNTWICLDWQDTVFKMEDYKYFPEGICVEPPFGATRNVAFVAVTMNGDRKWCHVPHSVYKCWIKRLEIEGLLI